MNSSASPVVAVIDIGSNSIKVLVATRRAADRSVQALKVRTIDARISAGISRTEPRLSEDGMVRGLDAIRALLAEAAAFSPARIVLVATSAVRDAGNGAEFRTRVRVATGHDIRILTGDEEANLIGRGLTCDPALAHLRDFYVFDLGGGSLECLAFRDRRIEQAISLPLGCVRLTERFVPEPAGPLSTAASAAVRTHTRELLGRSSFRFSLLPDAGAVGTGGTVSTVRAILGAARGQAFDATSPTVTRTDLETLHARLAAMDLVSRKAVPGLPPARADVFPVALATLLAVADCGGLTAFTNSVFNLRYGLADEALGG